MVSNEKRGKLDAKETKCLFLDYYEGIKTYRLISVKIKKIIKYRDVIFMEESIYNGNNLKMYPSERSDTSLEIVMDKSFKSFFYDDDINDNNSKDAKEKIEGV